VTSRSTAAWLPAAQKLPDVGYLRQLNAEGILALRPQLVLASAQADGHFFIDRGQVFAARHVNHLHAARLHLL
jgi:iron complex transport system substrate-binding protein